MTKPFRFKEFCIEQDQCAMKVGTDGVLLGAWASLNHHPNSILDIGAGTGLIALQLAQRSSAELIDAVEIDAKAHQQAVENFENSSWSDRLFCYHASLIEFSQEIEEQYDLIVSNPPFFSNAFKSHDDQRNTARLTAALSFEQLLDSVVKLLSKTGRFSVIIPFEVEQQFIRLASARKLEVYRILHVKGTPSSTIKRSLIEFSTEQVKAEIKELIIETSRHQYTKAYTELVKDFYIKM